MLFVMSNEQIQAYFSDGSLLVLDKSKKIGIFFSPKQPRVPFTFSLANLSQSKLSEQNSSAAKRFEMI